MQRFWPVLRYTRVRSQNWRGVKILCPESAEAPHEIPIIAHCYQQYAPKFSIIYGNMLHPLKTPRIFWSRPSSPHLKVSSFPSPSRTQAWLWRVAHNKLVDSYRRHKRHVPLSIVEDVLFEHETRNPEQASIQQEENLYLRSLIQQLSPIQQQVLSLRFNDGLRCSQIASQLGKREGSIRSILSRTLNRLRELYEKV